MFKNKLIIIIAVFVLIFSGATIATYSGYKNNGRAKKEDVISHYGMYINKNAKKTRKLNYLDKKLDLVYARSENLSDNLPEKRKDMYGTYDVYVDDEKNEYYLLGNSNVLCGVKNSKIDGENATPITEEEALQLAEDYLNEIFNKNHLYELNSCEIPKDRMYYEIEYVKNNSGLKTDDTVRLWVNFDKEVCAFSAFNRGRYDNVNLNKTIAITAPQRGKEKVSDILSSDNFTIVDQYISKNDEGQVVMVSVIEYSLTNGTSIYPVIDEVSVVID